MTRSGPVALFLFLYASAAAADCIAPAWETRVTQLTTNRMRNTIAVADMNEDGILDVVTIKIGVPDEVIVAPGALAPGYFGAALPVYSGTKLWEVVARDLNGDHHLDLLILEDQDDTVAFLPGNGNGTFGAVTRSPLPNEYQWAVTDLTGDQVDDIAAFTYEGMTHHLTIFTGSTTGSFVETRRTALRTFPSAIAAADLDGDAAADLVVVYTDSTFDLFFGNGDGTFDPAVTKETGPYADKVTLDDVEGDGDFDILVSRSPDTLSIHRNLGGRLFSEDEPYPIDSPDSTSNGAFDFAAADFTGDGIRDVLASSLNGGYLATLRGRGDGTFDAPTFDSLQYAQHVGPVGAVVDLNGDGRLDVITNNWGLPKSAALGLLNRCGDLSVYLSGEPLVSAGTSVTYRVNTAGEPPKLLESRVAATGNVSILEGETVIGTATLDTDGTAFVTVATLALGEHALVARYSGDAQYEPAQSPPFTQRVTDATTTTVVSTAPVESVYGEVVTVQAVVTSSDGTTPTGYADLTLGTSNWEDVPLGASRSLGYLPVGSYTASARYLGNANYPPSQSTPVTHVVRKAPATVEIALITIRDRFGSSVSVGVSSRNSANLGMTGTLRLYDGNTWMASLPRSDSVVYFDVDGLSIGRHVFHAEYSGDSNFEPATSPGVSHQTFPPSGLHLDVRGNSDGNHLAWTQPDPGANHWTWNVVRSVAPSLIFGDDRFWGDQTALDSWANAGVVYLYRLEVRNWDTQQLLDASPIDLGVRMSFSDDPLMPGMTIRASHLQEILAATNFLRGKAGQSAVTFNDAAPGTSIRATHITTLRTKINEARVALGAAPVTFTRTIAPGDAIRAQDFQELREAVH